MKLKGKVINAGKTEGQAFVLEEPFSFIGDFDPDTGTLTIEGHQLFGESLANKILVCPSGKGGTIAPFVAYQAKSKGNAPAGILCQVAEPILCECAITINIPILCGFTRNPAAAIKTGQWVIIDESDVTVSEGMSPGG